MSVQETSSLTFDIWVPRLTYGEKTIIARSSLFSQLLTLFSSMRRVEVIGLRQIVTIKSRRWWLQRTVEQIPFRKIRYVGVAEMTVGGSPGLTPEGYNWRDQQENFVPYVMTTEGTRIDLFDFLGEGSIRTGWMGVVLGDDVVDFRGRQEDRAREFAVKVAAMVGVPCGIESQPLIDARSPEGKIKCTACGHFNASSFVKCLYCGAGL